MNPNRPVLSNAASNAEIQSYKRQLARENELQDHQVMAQMLSRAKSKDQLYIPSNNIREKYMLMAGAQRVLEGGRQERDKIVMERQYDRYKSENDQQKELGYKLVGKPGRMISNNSHIRRLNAIAS